MFSAESFILSSQFMLDLTVCNSLSTVSGAFCLSLGRFWKVEESNPLLNAHNANAAKHTGGKVTQKNMSICICSLLRLKKFQGFVPLLLLHLHICLGFSFPLEKKKPLQGWK